MSRSSSNTSEQVKTEIDPQLKEAYLNNLRYAQDVAGRVNAWGPYMGERFAQPSWAFGSASNTLQSLIGGLQSSFNPAQIGQLMNQSAGLLTAAAQTPYLEASGFGYDATPYQVQGSTVSPAQQEIHTLNRQAVRDIGPSPFTRGNVRDVGVDSVLQNLSAYENPYTQQVIDRGLADLDRARQLALQQTGASATAAGAFGGSRHAIAEAETNRNFADAVSRFTADQRSAGFQQAANLAQSDLARALAAQQANQQADLSTMGLLSDYNLRAQLANQGVDLNAALASMQALNVGAGANADRAQQANLATAQFGQQAALANQAALLDALRFNAAQAQQAELANQQAGFQNVQQLLQAAQLGGGLASQFYQLPMNAMQQQLMFDQYARDIGRERIAADMQQYNDMRFQELPALQIVSGALGINLPNLGMTSYGQSNTSTGPSTLQNIGQLAQLAALFF